MGDFIWTHRSYNTVYVCLQYYYLRSYFSWPRGVRKNHRAVELVKGVMMVITGQMCSLISIVGIIILRTVPWHGPFMNAAVILDHDVC